MDKFEVITPSQLLSPYINQYWFLSMDGTMCGAQRQIPAGNIILLFHRDGQMRTAIQNSFTPSAYLCGQLSEYTDLSYRGNLDTIMVAFHPIGAKAVFNMPMYEINNEVINISLLNDPQLSVLEQQLQETCDNRTCVNHIENFLLKRIFKNKDYNYKRLASVLQTINSGEYEIPQLANCACLGYKQFKRIFSDYTGINPKDFVNIKRFQKASKMLQLNPELSISQLSSECNYHDKSHLIKAFKKYTGHTPREYLSLCDPYSEYHSQFRLAFLDRPTSFPIFVGEFK